MEVIEKIYAELKLPAFEENKDNFEKHIFSQDGYKKNTYGHLTFNTIILKMQTPLGLNM